MMYSKLLFALCLGGLLAWRVEAQTPLNHTFWLRTNLVYMSGNTTYTTELICRQAEDAPLMRGIRTWVQMPVYKHWHWEASPIAWLLMYQKTSPTDNSYIVKQEWRTAHYVTYKMNLQHTAWQTRTGIEARFDTDKKHTTWHLREKISWQYQFKNKWTLVIFDELFLPFQHRLGTSLQIHFLHKKLTLEMGGFYGQRAQEPTQNCACTITFQYKYQQSKK